MSNTKQNKVEPILMDSDLIDQATGNVPQRTQHLDDAILKFVRGEWEDGFKFNAQPIDKRMDVFEVTPIPGSFWQDKRAMITIRNLRTGEIEYRYRDVTFTYEKLKKFLIDWLTAVEDVHGGQCFERHVQ